MHIAGTINPACYSFTELRGMTYTVSDHKIGVLLVEGGWG